MAEQARAQEEVKSLRESRPECPVCGASYNGIEEQMKIRMPKPARRRDWRSYSAWEYVWPLAILAYYVDRWIHRGR